MRYIEYARQVIDGKIVAGKYIQLACERFFYLMENDLYEFRPERVQKVIDFISILRHYTGRHAGKHFILEPWQEFIIASIYGFFLVEDGTRLVKAAYIEMARKQGKSALAAAICLYHLVYDDEMDAEVDLAANSKEQAKISFRMCSNFSKGIDPKYKKLIPFRDKITYESTMSILKVMAADDSKLDGFNASMYLLDEYHAAKNGRLKDVLQSSQGMRENPMSIIITTAGFDKLGPCYQYRTMCTEVLNKLKKDDSLFIALYCLDEGDDWKDEAVWIKSNPNLGVTVRSNYIREQVQKAVNSPSEEVGIKTKTINLWCDSGTVWVPEHYILAASLDVNLEDYKDMEAFAGIDLSSTSDLTSVSYLIPTAEKMIFKTYYYLPEIALKEKRFKELYGEWRRQGCITITPGNVTDYDYILNDLIEKNNMLYLCNVGYDSWNATQFVINATDKGLPMEPISQTIGNFNKPTKEMERLLLSGKAIIDNNVINRHCYRNVVMARDRNGNTKPSKQYEEKKIDGVISELMALSAYLESPRYSALI
ncbi:terminase TerL endonuclease subunit [uncultured Bacteroides sp.]|uniref:terminase large subunit n=1 Tax=uncultured Bacteroides sp. TaxID=162156 RepID=UPI002AA7F1F2|nr:terminase TerL endonuclease subunit [uncultured Bacteroides sp.]